MAVVAVESAANACHSSFEAVEATFDCCSSSCCCPSLDSGIAVAVADMDSGAAAAFDSNRARRLLELVVATVVVVVAASAA